jgi:hypothetical protein
MRNDMSFNHFKLTLESHKPAFDLSRLKSFPHFTIFLRDCHPGDFGG